MRRGAWHQFGDRSQRLAEEQLRQGAGVGVIISERDLSRRNAAEYAQSYHQLGAHVLIDQQFYNPQFTNPNLQTYPINKYRAAISQMKQLSDKELTEIASELRIYHSETEADGLIAPAVLYEAGHQDAVTLNKRLFDIAKQVGDELNIPTYATVMLGRSATSSKPTLDTALSHATALKSDGWYFGFEFSQDRIPYSREDVYRCCVAGLTLACTGKPVLHAYAGPMALLSLGFGATGTAIGHAQNLWQFNRKRWEPAKGRGGSAKTPPRFFSGALWGTIVYPDETVQLKPAIRSRILTQSPFSTPTSSNLTWNQWDANKHLVNIICSTVSEIAAIDDPRENARAAIKILEEAVALHKSIGIKLRDNTNAYQENWRLAMVDLLTNHSDDFDYLEMLW